VSAHPGWQSALLAADLHADLVSACAGSYRRTMAQKDRAVSDHSQRRMRLLVPALVILVAIGSVGVYFAFIRSTPRCATLVPNCTMKRLPDQTLIGRDRSGALGPVRGAVPANLISFDEALARAWAEDGHADATAVQVTLGTADPAADHWDSQSRYFYGIDWFGVCPILAGGGRPGASPPPAGPCDTTWGTVIDATNGAFIVGG